MSDLIDRAAAIDALCAVCGKACDKSKFVYNAPQDEQVILCPEHYCLCTLPSVQPYTIHSDGRLWVTVDDIDKVTAVVVDEHKSKFCKQFYEDYEDEQPDIIRCKDCKHWIPYDWMFSEIWQSKNIADYPEDDIGCALCDMAMKANDFCSRADRREVTT